MAKAPQLIFEELSDQENRLYLTLIEYKRVKHLTIIENIIDDEIYAYSLDNLEAEGIDQAWFMGVAVRWFYSASERYPLSFEFAKIGQSDVVKKALKTFNIVSVSRVIGKLFVYDINAKPKVKRRKVQYVSEATEVRLKPREA